MKKADFFIIVFSLIICSVSILAVIQRPGSEPVLIIESPDDTWIYQLTKDQTVTIKGSLGITEVVIESKTAFIKESPCLNKLCVHTPPISRHGQWTACMPNRVIIRIENSRTQAANTEHTVDATAF